MSASKRQCCLEAATTTQAALSVMTQELLASKPACSVPLAEKTAGCQPSSVPTSPSTGAEFGKASSSLKASEAQKAFVGMVDSAAKNAPAGSGNRRGCAQSAVRQQRPRFGPEGRQAGDRSG